MKTTTKAITVILLLVTIFFQNCEKNKQTDKPLYDVLIRHNWKLDKISFYKFNKDSVLDYYFTCDESLYPDFHGFRWWIKGTNEIYFEVDNGDHNIDTGKYVVDFYNDIQLKTYYYSKISDTEPDKEQIFKACN